MQAWFSQIFLTVNKVWLIICEKSCQKSVTISVTLRSILLSFCRICVIITSCCLLSQLFGGLSMCVLASKLDQVISMSLRSEQMSHVTSTVLFRRFVGGTSSRIQRT